MKSVTQGNIKMAVSSLRSNKARSFLTMLGVIIGTASVITVVGIGQGIQNQVSHQISQLGKDLVTVRAGQVQNVSLASLTSIAATANNGLLTSKDLVAAQRTADVTAAVPIATIPGAVQGDHTINDNVVLATSGDLPQVIKQTLAFGEFFSADDNGSDVAVLGYNVAQKLFDEPVPLGRSFTFRGQVFVVRGIMNQFDSAPFSTEVDFNNAIFIPYGTAKNLLGGNLNPYEILVKPKTSDSAITVAAHLKTNLAKLHSDPHDLSVLTQSESLSITNKILDLLTRLIAGIAAVSLLVGGVGIMNIMLVSVTERMHEVGIRKAVGATNRQILNQFVVEAAVLSLVGGVLGILTAFLVDILLHIFTHLSPAISWQVVVLASFVSIILGVLFGTVPALKAARKDPISALRNE